MTTPKTNKQNKLDQIRASLKRARIGHHLKIASIHGIDPATLIDPTVNIQAAYRIYQSQGLKAWSVYNNNSYRRYLQ